MRKTAFALRAYASRLFCLGIVATIVTLVGCGGSSAGSTGGGTTTTVTSVTVNPSTATVTAGGSQSFSATVVGQNNPSQAVTWSVSPTSAGTITTGGVFTSSATIAAVTTATITAASTIPGYTNITGIATVTVNPASVPQPTVTIAATPSTITLGATTTLTWSSTNATSCTASGAWSGNQAISGSTAETPSATGTTTYTLTCTGAGGSISASTTVTVNAAPLPDITSVSPSVIYANAELGILPIQLNGTDFAVGQSLFFGNPESAVEEGLTSTQLNLTISIDTPHFSPGFVTATVCENSNETGCGTSGTLAFLGARNYCAASSSGELFCLDQAQGATPGQKRLRTEIQIRRNRRREFLRWSAFSRPCRG